MLSASITSTISLRTTRGSPYPFSANDYSHPFFYSSSSSCSSCCCCCYYSSNPLCKEPISPNYCYNFYGLRQSSLIQWSPYRRPVRSGTDRLPVCDVSERFRCDRLCGVRGKWVGGSKGGFKRCIVFDEMPEKYDTGGVDEAEAVLSLLMEDVESECFQLKKETRRFVKKPAVVDKSENGKVSNTFGGKKRIFDVQSEARYEEKPIDNLRKKEDKRREDIIWREQSKKERKDYVLKNRMAKEKEESEALLRKSGRKVEGENQRKFILGKENRKVESREEEKEDLMRREGHWQKGRRDGSSCSSFYSFSSTGDHESENETDLGQESFLGDSSSGRVRNSGTKIVNQNSREEDQKQSTGSSVVESDFRKKSEKMLSDVSIEEMRSSKKTLIKDSSFSTGHGSNYGKVSNHYSNYHGEKVKSSDRTGLDEDSRRSETGLKYKQFSEFQDKDVSNSYGSQKSAMSGKVASEEKVEEIQPAVGFGTRDSTKYKDKSPKVSEVSGTQEINISKKTYISEQRIDTKEYSTNNLVSDRMDLGGISQNIKDKHGKSVIKMESEKLIKEEDQLNLTYGASLESKQLRSQMQVNIMKIVNNRNESDEFITPSGNSGAISVASTTPPSYLPETEVLSVGPNDNTPLSHHNSSHGEPSNIISHEDANGSAARLEKSSAHYVGEFVNQIRSEISTSEIQQKKKTRETKFVHEQQTNILQSTSRDPHSEKYGLKHEDEPSGSKGPSDEIWKVDEPYVKEPPKAVIQENEKHLDNAIAKRNGKSLWNIFTDIFRLGWSPHSESHSSSRKTGGKSSPNQSTGSETWFSGHEENEGTSLTKGLTGSHQLDKTHSLVIEGSSSSTSEKYLKSTEVNLPSSSSVVLETSGGEVPEENLGVASSTAMLDSSVSIPALRLRRFSAMQVGLESGKANTPPDSGVSMEQEESLVNEEELKQRKLMRKDQVVKDRFDEWEEAYRVEAEQIKIDEMFMREALSEAKKAADNWEVPVGAVLVHNGKIIARGYNLVEELRDSTAHAEIICIREASNVLRTWRLSETTLYITLEPCPMCAGAILQARVDTVVWGAPNKLLGADGSWIRLFPSGDGGNNGLEQSDKVVAPVHPFHPNIIVRRGVLASECADAMQHFFRLRRKKEKKPETPTSSGPPPSSRQPISHHPSKLLAKMHDTFGFMLCL